MRNAIVAGLVLFSSWSGADVRVCLPDFREDLLTLSLLTAQDHGLFEKHGLKVKFSAAKTERQKNLVREGAHMNGDRGVSTKLAAGDCDLGVSTMGFLLNVPAKTLSQTQPLMISSYGKDYDTHLVVAKNSKIQSVQDLKGKRVRVGQTPNRVALNGILKEAGLKLEDVKQVYHTNATETLAQLERGEVDAAINYVPTLPYMLASGKVRVIKKNIIGGYIGETLPHSVLMINKTYASKNAETVRKLRAALNEAKAYMERNPSELVFTLARHTQELGLSAWPVDKVTAERAGAFFGKPQMDDWADVSADKREQTWQAMQRYAAKLSEMGVKTSGNDLSAWLGSAPHKVSSM